MVRRGGRLVILEHTSRLETIDRMIICEIIEENLVPESIKKYIVIDDRDPFEQVTGKKRP